MIWNDNSCAFDAFFTVLINIWKEMPCDALKSLTRGNTYFAFLIGSFTKVREGTQTWEQARDQTRTYLTSNTTGQRAFGFHRTRVAIAELMETMLTLSSPVMCTTWKCSQCGTVVQQQPSNSLIRHCSFSMWQELARECDLSHVETWGHTQNWLDTSLIVKCQKTCRICRKQIAQGKHEYIGVPKMLVLTLEDVPHAIADPIIKIHAAGNGICWGNTKNKGFQTSIVLL